MFINYACEFFDQVCRIITLNLLLSAPVSNPFTHYARELEIWTNSFDFGN